MGRNKTAPLREGNEEYRKVYLRSDHWISFKTRYRREQPWKCAIIGCENSNLDLHHLTYKRIGKEEIGDCVLLCRKHHDMVHALIEKDGVPLRRAHVIVARAEGVKPRKKVIVLPEAGREVMRPGHSRTLSKKKKKQLRERREELEKAKGPQPLAKDGKPYKEIKRMALRPIPTTQPTSEQILKAGMDEQDKRRRLKKGLMKRD